MRSKLFRLWTVTLVGLLVTGSALGADADPVDTARRTWQLLDYIAVDYAGAVRNGKVERQAEYDEMQEFATTASLQIEHLPKAPGHDRLQTQVAELRALVSSKAEPATVAAKAQLIAAALLKAYPFPVSPTRVPDLARGARLFEAQCAACHGASGRGDGPLAASLTPHPTNLADRLRARERSLLALYQVITQGVKGTAMASFKDRLSDDDRWALAFYAGSLSYSDKERAAGAAIWKSNAEARAALTGLDDLARTSESALTGKLEPGAAAEVVAWARSHPDEVVAGRSLSTAVTRAKLAASLAAVKQGDRSTATRLALSAYLEGFEPLEPALRARDASLLSEIEAAMGVYRARVSTGSVADAEASEANLQALMARADAALAPGASDALTTYIGALTILLREGLEALLVVVAMIAFLRKAQRPDVLRYVHAGWLVALGAGGFTWLAATYLVAISGASREMTEGFSSLFAAVVLLGVGMWMHRKSIAGRWQIYLQQKLSSALNRRTAWLLFGLSFVAVYREVFETVLFYAALWTQGNGLPLLAGLGSGVVLLAILAAVLLRTSARLPIGQFFAASSLLVAILAVVLVGKGVAGLQEAGLMHVSPVLFPRVDVLGIYPSAQTLLAQAVVLLVAVAAYVINVRWRPAPPAPRASKA